jgi:hypothetical protein
MNFGTERAFENNDNLTVVYCLVFLMITFVKLKYPKMFLGLLRCLFSKNVFLDFSNEFQDVFSAFKILLFIAQNLIFSTFFYVVIKFTNFDINGDSDVLFLKIFGILTIYLSSHYFIALLVSKIFNFSEVYKGVHVLKFSYLKLVAVALLPVVLFFTYVDIENTKFASAFLSYFFLALLLLRAVLLLVKNNKLIIESFFYFIVYLCTLEIAPILLIFKVVVNK